MTAAQTDQTPQDNHPPRGHGSVLTRLLAELPLFESMDQAIEAAAKHLPEGYEIIITITRHGYGVSLGTPECDEIDLDGGDGMRSDVWDGIMQANGVAC